jgi:hypothetical protein
MRYSLIAFVFVTLLYSCYKESDHAADKEASYNSTVSISLQPATIPADSFSTSRILITLPWDADSTKSTVQLRTDLGAFVENNSNSILATAKQNSDSQKRIAIVALRSGSKTGVAHITASIQTQTQTLTDTFVNAYPDYFMFSASTLAPKASTTSAGEVVFTTRLFKQAGVPSQGNVTDLVILDSTKKNMGLFRSKSPFSDPSGVSQFIWVLGDSTVNGVNYTGKLYAIAQISKASGVPLADTLILFSSK